MKFKKLKPFHESTEMNKRQAWAMDRNAEDKIEVYIEYDNDLEAYCVFGSNSGFCYHYDFDEESVKQWVEDGYSEYELV